MTEANQSHNRRTRVVTLKREKGAKVEDRAVFSVGFLAFAAQIRPVRMGECGDGGQGRKTMTVGDGIEDKKDKDLQ